ncbi:MAG: M48 family metalloprotease [Pseudomonadota bacterium]
MTALSDYAKLEAEAVFFDAQSGLSTEVVLSFGERSLVIMALDDRALAHWPLVTLRSPSKRDDHSVKIAPDQGAEDYVSVRDTEMIRAIQTVCPNLYTAPTKPPRRRVPRRYLVGALIVLLAISAYLGFPAMLRHIIDDIAPEQERRLGMAMRSEMIKTLGTRNVIWQCVDSEGLKAIEAITGRVAAGSEQLPQVSIIDLPIAGTLLLPGGEILIFRGLLDKTKTPEAMAGLLAHQMAHLETRDALNHSIASFAIIDLVKFWWGAQPEDQVIEDATEAFLSRPYSEAVELSADMRTTLALAATGLPTRPFAADLEDWGSLDQSPLSFSTRHPGGSDRAAKVRGADKVGGNSFKPALDDRSWLALGNICDERQPFE